MNDLLFFIHDIKLAFPLDIHIYFHILYQQGLTDIVETNKMFPSLQNNWSPIQKILFYKKKVTFFFLPERKYEEEQFPK